MSAAVPGPHDEIRAAAERVRADGPSKPRAGRDRVNLPLIRNWLEAIGDENPIYTDESAAIAAGTAASSRHPRWRRCGPCAASAPSARRTIRSAG